MPQAVTDFGASAWLAGLFGVIPLPGIYWIALADGDPGTDSDGTILADTEPSDPSYARVETGAGAGYWSINGSYLVNNTDIDFGTAGSDWGYIDHFVICTDSADGDIYAYGELSEPQFIEADSQLIIPAGSIVLALVPVEDAIAI